MLSRMLALWCLVGSLAAFAPAADWETEGVARERAADWLKQREGKITLAYKAAAEQPGFAGQPIAGSPDTMYVLKTRDWYVTLGFKGKIAADDTAESLTKRLKYVALDTVPTPGLEVKGWEIRPRTPVSSFREGVEIREFTGGVAKIAVKTKCFCLAGTVRKELLGPVPADAGLPAGTFFQLRQSIPLEIEFEAPLGFRP